MACPAVAGVAALVLEVFPDATAKQVREIISQTCLLPPGQVSSLLPGQRPWNPYYGYGLVNAFKAIKSALLMSKNWSIPQLPTPDIEADK